MASSAYCVLTGKNLPWKSVLAKPASGYEAKRVHMTGEEWRKASHRARVAVLGSIHGEQPREVLAEMLGISVMTLSKVIGGNTGVGYNTVLSVIEQAEKWPRQPRPEPVQKSIRKKVELIMAMPGEPTGFRNDLIRRWASKAKPDARWMVVIYDTYEKDYRRRFFRQADEVGCLKFKAAAARGEKLMQLTGCYDLSIDLEPQLTEG